MIVCRRPLSSWNQRGYDITHDSLSFGHRPKVIIDGYASSGFDVLNTLKNVTNDPSLARSSGTMHMNGSILAFPFGCFLWKVEEPEDVTAASLAPVFWHRPKIEYLLIGCSEEIPNLPAIRNAAEQGGIVVEKLSLANAIGTFNIMNAEDRHVAVALVRERD